MRTIIRVIPILEHRGMSISARWRSSGCSPPQTHRQLVPRHVALTDALASVLRIPNPLLTLLSSPLARLSVTSFSREGRKEIE
jgi:hypothetical protein